MIRPGWTVVLAACGSFACNVYNDSLLQGTGGAGGTGTTPQSCEFGECWWSGENEQGCQTAGKPGPEHRPSPDANSATELPPIYLGLEKLRLGSSFPDGTPDTEVFNATAWQGFGFDLDGVCTNSATCPQVANQVSCRSPSPQLPFDGLLCRDNTFARLQPVAGAVPQIGENFGLTEDIINCGIYNGAFNIIAKVSGYNGELSDDQIRLDFYASPGTEGDNGWTCFDGGSFLQNYTELYPRWLVSAPWRIAEDDFAEPRAGGDLPPSRFSDANAFVRDGYMVAQLPPGSQQNLPGDNFEYPGFNLRLHQGIWAGRMVKNQQGIWRVEDGLAVGRVRKDDLLASFRELGFCEDQGTFWDTLITYVTENADTLASGETDPNQDCDAMSAGLAFTATQLTVGGSVKLAPPPGCAPPGDGGT